MQISICWNPSRIENPSRKKDAKESRTQTDRWTNGQALTIERTDPLVYSVVLHISLVKPNAAKEDSYVLMIGLLFYESIASTWIEVENPPISPLFLCLLDIFSFGNYNCLH